MPCIDKIASDILNSCDTIPRGGFETIAWAINREDIDTVTHDSTYDTLVEAITRESGTRSYTVTAVKKEMNAGFDLVTGDDIPDTYLNYFSFKPYEKTAEAITNLDSMNDLVIIAELKGSKTEGCFVIYGLEKGLYKNSGTQRQNDSNGLPIYEMQSMEGQGERYSRFIFWDTDYAISKAAIIALTESYGAVLNVSNCVNDSYDTFANATPTGFDAIYSTAGTQWAGSADEIVVVSGTQYLVEFTLVLNSGAAPDYNLVNTFGGAPVTSDAFQTAAPGSNAFTFTCNSSNTSPLAFRNIAAANYEITNLSVREVL